MASSRASATRALYNVARASRQTRQLHITGSSSHPIRTASADKPTLGRLSQASTSRTETDDSIRTFSTSDSTYDSPIALQSTAPQDRLSILPTPTPTPFSPTNQSRQFNTSRQLKRVGDNSTIDFAYLPEFPIPSADAIYDDVRVPLVPWNFVPRPEEELAPLMSEVIAEEMPAISTVALDSTHISAPSAMADVHDGGGHLLDFHEFAETVTNAAKRVTGMEREDGEGIVRQVWSGILDDVFGQKVQKA